ncbi:MAG: metal-dependent transcriptional regulator [Victivallales bacterium]|nr:metal-dependent transcriptional regulator [Victivallales bacterium]
MNSKHPEKLSKSLSDYIEAIDILTISHGHAHTKDIAAHLKVKMPSVTIALRHLASLGYITYSSHLPVELTAIGQRIADRIARNHRAFEHFFLRVLALPPEKAHEASGAIDHILGDDVMRRFIIFTQAIANRSDSRSLAVHLSEAMEYLNSDSSREFAVISELSPGVRCCYHRASALLSPSEARALFLQPGEPITIGEWTLDRSAVAVYSASGERRLIPAAVAENLWVILQPEEEL